MELDAEERTALWPPVYYERESDGSETLELFFSLQGYHREPDGRATGHVGNVFWGDNYVHYVPLVWTWDENIIVPPLGWKVDSSKGTGLVQWGRDCLIAPASTGGTTGGGSVSSSRAI